MCRRHPRKIIGFVLLGLVAVAAFGLVVMGLWNALLPSLFGLKAIGFWQATGLLVLCRILFGGFHGRHGGRFSGRHRLHLLEKWDRMSPEEKERFRQGMRGCGWGRRG